MKIILEASFDDSITNKIEQKLKELNLDLEIEIVSRTDSQHLFGEAAVVIGVISSIITIAETLVIARNILERCLLNKAIIKKIVI